MRNTLWIYGAVLGSAVLILKGIEFYYTIDLLPAEIYIGAVILLLVGLSFWAWQNVRSASTDEDEKKSFKRNQRAVKSLNISQRELEILDELALGKSNQEIADKLSISINVVKNNLSALYQKLEVSRRSKATKKARSLKLVS